MYPSALVSDQPHSITDVDVDHAPWNLPRQQAVADDADGDSLEGLLLRILADEENSDGFQSSSQVLSGNEHGPPVISGSHLRPPNYVWDPDDFLEEKDLVGSAFSSTLSSENTCVLPSMNLDDEYFDYFDPVALLRELAPSTKVQASVSASRGSHQVVFQPLPSGSFGGSGSNNNKNPRVMKTVVSASPPSIYIGGLNHTHPPPAASVEESPDVGSFGGSSSNNNKNPRVMKTVVSASPPSIYIGGLNHTHPPPHPPPAASVEESPYVAGSSKEQGLALQRRPKRGRSSLQLEGRSSKVSRRFA